MKHKIETCINEIVRTSNYELTEFSNEKYENLNVNELVDQLVKIKSLNIDTQKGALNPPRIPNNINYPEILESHFEEIVQALVPYGNDLHPGIKHMLLAIAINTKDGQKLDSLKPLLTGIDNGNVYQPTITYASMLRPEWYDPKHYVKPQIRGGGTPTKTAQGVTTEIFLSIDGVKVNPQEMLSWSKPIKLTDAKIAAPIEMWKECANIAWQLPNPPTTSLWLMGFGDLDKYWSYIPPGAALFNPEIDSTTLNSIFHNSLQHNQNDFFTRMGNGIADIYPLKNDASLVAYVNTNELLEAPIHFNSMLSIYHHVVSPQTFFNVPEKWIDNIKTQRNLMLSMDLIPQYSIFKNDGAFLKLEAYKASGNLNDLQLFFKDAIDSQLSINTLQKNQEADVFTLGVPQASMYISPPQVINTNNQDLTNE